MATLLISLNMPGFSSGILNTRYQKGSRHVEFQNLNDLMGGLASGTARSSGNIAVVTVVDNETQAAGTVTCASVSAADTVHVGNVLFTAVSGTPTAHQFKVGVSDTADGLSLATAINADTTLSPFLAAVNVSGVVTLTSIALGVGGNLIQLSSSNNTRLAVVAFASGAADSGAKTYNF